jgi:hypothetical protein
MLPDGCSQTLPGGLGNPVRDQHGTLGRRGDHQYWLHALRLLRSLPVERIRGRSLVHHGARSLSLPAHRLHDEAQRRPEDSKGGHGLPDKSSLAS